MCLRVFDFAFVSVCVLMSACSSYLGVLLPLVPGWQRRWRRRYGRGGGGGGGGGRADHDLQFGSARCLNSLLRGRGGA